SRQVHPRGHRLDPDGVRALHDLARDGGEAGHHPAAPHDSLRALRDLPLPLPALPAGSGRQPVRAPADRPGPAAGRGAVGGAGGRAPLSPELMGPRRPARSTTVGRSRSDGGTARAPRRRPEAAEAPCWNWCMARANVAVLRTRPETIIADYGRLLRLAGY